MTLKRLVDAVLLATIKMMLTIMIAIAFCLMIFLIRLMSGFLHPTIPTGLIVMFIFFLQRELR